MEIDLQKDEREFIINAVYGLLDGFPEYTNFGEKFIDLLKHCGEVGCTLHVN